MMYVNSTCTSLIQKEILEGSYCSKQYKFKNAVQFTVPDILWVHSLVLKSDQPNIPFKLVVEKPSVQSLQTDPADVLKLVPSGLVLVHTVGPVEAGVPLS